MRVSLECKKIKRTGFLPAFLGGGILAAAVPVINMAVRSERYLNLADSPIQILLGVNGWDRWIQSFSKHVLTKEKDLQGEKDEGVDSYTGTYTATYDGFNGKEFIFGGTALERENGNQLQVTYKLTIEDGSAELNWIAGSDEYSVANGDSEDTKEYTVLSGDNYIVLKGENFSGSLELTVKDAEK